jgi:hypothetical protein
MPVPTLYTSITFDRYFSLPAGHELPEGDYVLRSLKRGNAELHVDPEAVAPYEITREEAEAYVCEQVEQGLSQVWALAQLKAQERAEERAESRKKARQVAKNLFGFTAEELREDPEVAEAHADQIDDFFKGLKTLLGGALRGDAEGLEAADEQMQAFKAALEEAGVEVSEDFERLPEKLHKAFHSAERKQSLKEAASQLRALRAELPEMRERLDQFLQEKAEELEARADEIHVVKKDSSHLEAEAPEEEDRLPPEDLQAD